MSGWWTKYPMPEGWEVKYHWETKRFFYIDHINKKTVWNDPRIELYQEAEGLGQPKENVLSGINEDDDESSSSSENNEGRRIAILHENKARLREKKANLIHQKFPEFTLSKITSLLESNYDNEFSVESKLSQELRQLIEEQLIEEKAKIKEAEDRVKKAKIKEAEDHEKKAVAERERKSKEEEIRKKSEEQNKKYIKAEIKLYEEEFKKRTEEAEKKRIEEEKRKQIEKEKTSKSEEVIRNIKKDEDLEKEDKTKNNKINKLPPMYGNYERASTSQFNNNSGNVKKSLNQRGPDKMLCSGVDPSNYVGPNRELLCGRDKSLAKGPEPLNRCGPQPRCLS